MRLPPRRECCSVVPMRVAQDPRVGLASPELRLVYPQIFRASLPGPDHVGAVVVRAQLLGADPRAVAERVVDEARRLGLLVPEGNALVSVHRPRPRGAHVDPAARRAAVREADALRNHLKRAAARGVSAEDALDGYVYQGRGASADTPRVSTPDKGGLSTPDTPLDTPPSEGEREEEERSSSSSSSPANTDGNANSDRQRATPGGGGVSGPVSAPSRHRTPPPPPHPPYPLTVAQVMGILTGTSQGRVGDGTAVVRAWMMFRLVELEVPEARLRRMAALAKGGRLLGQREREERGQRVTDLRLLAAPDGEPTVLVSWLNAAASAIADDDATRERAAREKAERERAKPYQAELGLPRNEGDAPAVAPAPTMAPALAGRLTSLASRLAPTARAVPSDAPAAAVGDATRERPP